MGIMSFLRNRMGIILVAMIALALLLFIAMDVAHYGGSMFRDDNTVVGEVAGQTLADSDYNNKVKQISEMYEQQMRMSELPTQYQSMIQETAWQRMVSDAIVNHEIDKLGLAVGASEEHDMIQGNDPNPQIVQAFQGANGQLDRGKLDQFLARVSQAPDKDPTSVRWNDFIDQIVDQKRSEKYLGLVVNGLYINSLDAKDDYEAKNKLVNLRYVRLDYTSIPDNKVSLTDDDYQSYYNDNKQEFDNPQETRTLQYVSFNAAPSKADTDTIKAQITKLVPDFKTTKDDSSYVAMNADTKNEEIRWEHKGQLDPKVDSLMLNAAPGFVYGPYLSSGSFKISKLIASETGPDSVKARHILVQGASLPAMQKTADSIKQLIQSGKANFADMALKYSADKGSAEKSGELGMFARGAMVPQFEDAAFNGKKGEITTVVSQYGVHIIEIEDQKGSQKVVKVATIDKAITASQATQSAAYTKAQRFLGAINDNDFSAEAGKEKLTVTPAQDIPAMGSNVGVLPNAREVVRWAYKAKVGDVTDQVYTLGTQYIVAQLTEIKPKGILPLELVKNQIKPMVLIKAKAKILEDKLKDAENGTASLPQVAQKVGAAVVPLQNIVFANPIVPSGGAEYKLVGAAFGSNPGKVSAPVDGNAGVYVFTVDGFVKPAPLTNIVREQQQLGQGLAQRAEQSVFTALKDKANVKDYRSKFL
jgi:peptidyl-prolyl cis-trans isomerase D